MRIGADQLHITESLTRLGGVETLVKQIVGEDPSNYAAALLDLLGPEGQVGSGLRNSRLSSAMSIRSIARKRFAHARHLVFHNFAGLTMLSPVIPHDRKTLFIHTNSEDVFSLLPSRLPFLDGILVSGTSLESGIRARIPTITVPITALDYPLDELYFESGERAVTSGLMIGYSGRLESEQKRVFRLVEFCKVLEAAGINFMMEIAGCGSAADGLQRLLPSDRCHFLGVLSPPELQRAYRRWDYLICTSDYETGPLVALEAMATGTIPILPDIPCQAASLLEGLAIRLYTPGDMMEAAKEVIRLSQEPLLRELRCLIQKRVSDRRVENFVQEINEILGETFKRPALGVTPSFPRGIEEYLPFSVRKSGNAFLR